MIDKIIISLPNQKKKLKELKEIKTLNWNNENKIIKIEVTQQKHDETSKTKSSNNEVFCVCKKDVNCIKNL